MRTREFLFVSFVEGEPLTPETVLDRKCLGEVQRLGAVGPTVTTAKRPHQRLTTISER